MGVNVNAAVFLARWGWRREAFPLDWSLANFELWAHMLSDDFQTLLRKQSAEHREHPYNRMFGPGANCLFPFQASWANDLVAARVTRLRCALERGRAFGLAICCEDQAALHSSSLEDLLKGAEAIADGGYGFCHIVVVWVGPPSLERAAAAHWPSLGRSNVSLLRYTPAERLDSRLGKWRSLSLVDHNMLANLLRTKFHPIFGGFKRLPQVARWSFVSSILMGFEEKDVRMSEPCVFFPMPKTLPGARVSIWSRAGDISCAECGGVKGLVLDPRKSLMDDWDGEIYCQTCWRRFRRHTDA